MATVLLVEPNDHLRTVFRRLFSRAGFQLVEAVDAEGALGAAHRGVPDLIVVEGSVRDAGGVGLPARLAREVDLCQVPVIVLAARPRGDAAVDGEIEGWGASVQGPLMARLQELQHPFRPGRLVELAQGTLASSGSGRSAPPERV